MNKNFSKDRKRHLKRIRLRKIGVKMSQAFLLTAFILTWEICARLNIIDSFMISSPSRMLDTFLSLSSNGLLTHISVTLYETLTGFIIGVALGIFVATVLWWSLFLSDVFEPFLVVLNSLPKVALGPVIIIWMGAGSDAIIFMAIAISLIVTIMELLNGFHSTELSKIKMGKTFCASRRQIFFKIVFPSNIDTLFNSMKINIGLSLVGVISGEFLVSKSGLGYLIVYGGQVFKLDLVMTSVIILAIVAALLYVAVSFLEKTVKKVISHSK